MQSSGVPSKFPVPFASSAGAGFTRTIPTAPSGTPGQASLQQGFPPENFTAVAAGGTPPFGQDFNGLLNQMTQWEQWFSAGGPIVYDATFQTAIGGYPKGAIVQSVTTLGTVYLSTTENNITNPDTGGLGWVSFSFLPLARTITPGVTQRLTAALAAAATSVTFTADYVTAATALGGQAYTVPNVNLTLNTGTTGAGGMDTGSIPTSGFLSIYLIYNPTTQTPALLGTIASQSTVYGGANMPSGYTASALISIWPVATSQLVAGNVVDREFYWLTGPSVLTSASATSITAISMTSAVPSVARKMYGFFREFESGTVTANSGSNFGSVNNASAFQIIVPGPVSGAAFYYTGWLPLTTPQTIYYKVGQASSQATVVVEGYSI